MNNIPETFEPLSGGWTVTPVSGPIPADWPRRPIPARVPGVIHTDLLSAGVIADPFDGDNEAAQQWIGDTSWRYETTFTWRDDGSTRHDLVAFGLDTVATIELNGQVVGRTENQHRSYRFDLRGLLSEGANTLTVTFAAPVSEATARAEHYGALPHSNHHDYNQLRKTASHFGWDWGIDVAGCGIWQPIGIDSWSGVRVASVRPLVDVDHDRGDGPTGILTAHVEIERDGVSPATPLAVTVAVGDTVASGSIREDAITGQVVAVVEKAALWWPTGFGRQSLYDVELTVERSVWRSRVGFRTVDVDTTADASGIPFELKINGKTVLVRGVNWIPDHAFLTEVSPERYRRRFADAAEANVNLIRVWGGGIYESDDFYELADASGILVWQDFLLACAAYTEEEHLASEIEAEAREQIARLSRHPSLVIWNGNNENVWGWADWGWRTRVGERTWGKGYYLDLFPRLLAELDPTRFYSPASPYSFGDFLHPNDERNGTMHIWDVWNQKDYSVYRDYRPRFVSEFGFQGPPAWSTLARVVHDEPMTPYAPEMLVHQKARHGNQKLERGQAPHLPPSLTIEQWHWATQLNQAHAIRFGIEHFRSLTPHNTGMILWQLNDNWPVVSWAAVDFDEHRKPLWYAVRDAYAPRLATIQPGASRHSIDAAFEGVAPTIDALRLVVANDTAIPIEKAPFVVTRASFDGVVLASETVTISVPARSASGVELPEAVSTFADPTAEYIVAHPISTGPELGIKPAFWNGSELRAQQLHPAPLDATSERTDQGYAVVVTAHSYLRDVFLQADRVDPNSRVDRGLVTLEAGGTARFRISSAALVDPAAFLDTVVLRTANQLVTPTTREIVTPSCTR